MEPKRRTASNIYWINFMLRRAAFGCVVTLMTDYPTMQVMTLIASSALTSAILLKGKAFDRDRTVSKLTILVFELICVWVLALMLAFSPGYIDLNLDLTEWISNVINGLAGLVLLLGFLLICYSIVW